MEGCQVVFPFHELFSPHFSLCTVVHANSRFFFPEKDYVFCLSGVLHSNRFRIWDKSTDVTAAMQPSLGTLTNYYLQYTHHQHFDKFGTISFLELLLEEVSAITFPSISFSYEIAVLNCHPWLIAISRVKIVSPAFF